MSKKFFFLFLACLGFLFGDFQSHKAVFFTVAPFSSPL